MCSSDLIWKTGAWLWTMPVTGAAMALTWTLMVLWSLVAMWFQVPRTAPIASADDGRPQA